MGYPMGHPMGYLILMILYFHNNFISMIFLLLFVYSYQCKTFGNLTLFRRIMKGTLYCVIGRNFKDLLVRIYYLLFC